VSRQHVSTRCAAVIMDELVALGVRDVVLAPGSRSAPLALAAWRAAERDAVRLHVRIDERTAGFLALGLGRASGVPAVVITTSGTAPAHLHPAVLEAWHGHVPVIVVSADRPVTMINTGANQTTDQVGLYGRHILGDARIAAVDDAPVAWRSALRRLMIMSSGVRSGRPGPVHLNVELVDPLTSVSGQRDVDLPARTPFDVEPVAAPVVAELPPGLRTVVVAGDARPAVGVAAAAFAAAAGVPLLAEPSSNARSGRHAIGCYRLLLGTALADRIERVVVFGHPTLSRPVQRLLSRVDVDQVVVAASPEWIDPGHAVHRVVEAVAPAPGPEPPSSEPPSSEPPSSEPEWLGAWRAADAECRTRVDRLVAGRLSGWQVADQVWHSVAVGGVLVAGSSQSLRDLDLAPVGPSGPEVHANRGLSGIDGTVSTAVGVALGRGVPVTALMGDLTFLHDLNGLLIGPDEPRPDLRIVVVNDDGGAIFHTLEQGAAEHEAAFERVFGTPHGADLGALVTGLGHRHRRVDDPARLAEALAAPVHGIEVLQCVISRADRRTVDEQLRGLAR